jgi:prophage regulatory protein
MQTVIARLPRTKEITGLSRSEIYRRESQGRFPKRLVLGPRCVGWLESELFAWVSEHAERSRKAP